MIRLLVSVSLLGFLAWRTNWQQVADAFAGLRFELWLAAVGLYVLTQIVSGLRWQLLARPLGFERTLGQHISYYFIGMYFNLFLPTSVGGDVIRAWYLDGGVGRRLAAFLSVFADRLSGLLVLLALACVAAGLCPVELPRWILCSVWGTAIAAVVGMFAMPVVARWTLRFSRVQKLLDGTKVYLQRPGLMLAVGGLSLIVQAVNIIIVWLVGWAIDVQVPASYYWILVPMVTLLTLAPISLNGMGVREGGMVLFLAPLGVPSSLAISLAFLWFSVFTVVSLCGGGLYLMGHYPRPKEQLDDEPGSGDSNQGRAGQPPQAARAFTHSARAA